MNKENVKIQIFCFHHAGGSSRVFHFWKSEQIEFIPMELPGHGMRIREAFAEDMVELSKELARNIIRYRKKHKSVGEIALFGHSLGAITAFCVAYELINKYGEYPICLQVAGRHAPQDEDPSEYRTDMGQEALKQVLLEMGGTPEELLLDKEFSTFFLPIVYSDYKLNESFVYKNQKLDIPIYGYCGISDSDAGEEHMNRWKMVTSEEFYLKSYEGEHFFLYDEELNFSQILAKDARDAYRKNVHKRMVENEKIIYERGVI